MATPRTIGAPVDLRSPAARRALLGVCAIAAGAGGGFVAVASSDPRHPLASLVGLPAPALLAASAGVVLLVLSVRRPWAPVVAFAAWLPVEDLVRKLAGNDIRVYAVKELLFVVALLGAARAAPLLSTLRAALGSTWRPTVALVAWAVAMAVPSALNDARLPILGLRFTFAYLPLVAVGFLIADRARRLEPSLRLLAGIAAAALAVGLLQVVIGPSFLVPAAPTPGLHNLVLERGISADRLVQRPTGTFVDPGRYATFAVLGLALAIAALVTGGRRRATSVAAVVVGGAAVVASGARLSMIGGALLLVVAVLRVGTRARRGRRVPGGIFGRALFGAAVVALSVGVLALVAPEEVARRTEFYAGTLDPTSSESEWAFRWRSYWGDTLNGVRLGGLVGRGTGTQSVGLQYLFGGSGRELEGLYKVESGFGSIAYELGAIGLTLWLWWSVAWWRRCWGAVRGAARHQRYGVAPVVLAAWIGFFLFPSFFAGLNYFQNYVTNAGFWLLSGALFGMATPQADRSALPVAARAAAP